MHLIEICDSNEVDLLCSPKWRGRYLTSNGLQRRGVREQKGGYKGTLYRDDYIQSLKEDG